MNRANLIEIFGPSHSTGFGTAGQEYAWPALVCSALGAYEANYASNGLIFAGEGNGYAKYLRPARSLRWRQSAPYVSPVDATILHGGLADLAANYYRASTDTYTPDAVYQCARALLAFAALGAYFDADIAGGSHASITYPAGSWVDVAQTDRNNGAGFRGTASVGAQLQIAVPSDFPGGEIDLFWIAIGSGNGGTWQITVAGSTRTSVTEVIDGARDSDQITAGKHNLKTTRITDLNPGAHTITATLTAAQTFGCGFDGWGIRAVNPPALVVAEQPRLTDANLALWFGAAAGGIPTSAALARLNRTLADAADSMGATYMTLPSLHLDPATYTVDGGHLNERGHAIWAERVREHLDSRRRRVQAPHRPNIGLAYAASWGNDTAPYAAATWTPGIGRRITLAGRVKRTGTPSVGETIATMPEGLRPASTASYLAPGSTGTPTVTIDTTGAVKYAAGALGASGTIDLDGIEYVAKATS